jgi:DNA-binding CsgD family transcriptional regulator
MTTPAPTAPLTPKLQRFAQYLMEGRTTRDIRALSGLSPSVTYKTMGDLRAHLGCPAGCKAPVIVHYLLTAGHVPPPAVDRPAPKLSTMDKRLLQAVATYSTSAAIAKAADVAPRYLPGALKMLLTRTGAPDKTQLVILAHAWGLLGASRSRTAPRRAGR